MRDLLRDQDRLTLREWTVPRKGIDLDGLSITNVHVTLLEPLVSPRDHEPPLPDTQSATVIVQMDVLDRDTRAPTKVVIRDTLPAFSWIGAPEEARLDFVRRVVIRAVTHEALEHLLVNGRRVFDPHKNEETTR